MVRQRMRIRFGKHEDLRFLGHRDVARVWERLLRISGLPVRRSEGFHPRQRLSFPSALPVGVAGDEEVLEAEFSEAVTAGELLAAIRPLLPAGLPVVSAELLPPDSRKAQVRRAVYEIPAPPSRRDALAQRIALLLASPHHRIERASGKSLDLRAALDEVRLDQDRLHFGMAISQDGSVRPREVLAALDAEDLEQAGGWLTRTVVELAG